MKIIYCCYGSAHSSVTAANLHLGRLPVHRRAAPGQILRQPWFDQTRDSEVGNPRLMGVDEWGHQVFTLGLAGGRREMIRALEQFLQMQGVDLSQIRFEDVLSHAGVPLRIGGYLSRRAGLVWLGRRLCVLGIWLKYGRFVRHVQRVKLGVAPLGSGQGASPVS